MSLFLYGMLRALSLLAWAITGDSTKVDVVKPLVHPARIRGYARFGLHGEDCPAVVRHADASVVDGMLFRPRNQSQRKKLDDFEGETYLAAQVDVRAVDGTEVADAISTRGMATLMPSRRKTGTLRSLFVNDLTVG